ncbi:hypothetical protein BASA83_000707 [Batrachochytrium salamandrivorans]|nr:hypothetical protein BASA83_000707 [Batrachochytrium salamandrivorans]
MVITSANAGLGDESKEGDINPQVTESSVTSSSAPSMTFPLEPSPSVTSSLAPSPSASSSMSDAVQKQMEENPILKHMFNGDEEYNDILMDMFNLQALLFSLMGQVEDEFSPHSTPVELNENPTQAEFKETYSSGKFKRRRIIVLLGEINQYHSKFERLESQYFGKYYSTLPENSVILSSESLYEKFVLLENHLNRSDWI